MTLAELRNLKASGQFHHATYRDHGRLWEGLWVYRNASNGFRGYEPAGCFYKDSPELDAAYAEVRGAGVSVGAYGEG